MVGTSLGRYSILARLGAGGMGEVYRARDLRLERDVAVKVLAPGLIADETARRRFRREALALSRLNHRGIATVYDFDSEGGTDFLVMELVAGEPLSKRIERGALPEEEAIGIALEIAEALDEAHEAGIIHRDLKPGNALVTPKGHVKVVDFGLAQLVQRPSSELATTALDSARYEIAGTLPYMSPEQLRAAALDRRSDLYALGVVLYEMATGLRPFRDTFAPRLTDAILYAPPVPPSTLNPRLSAALQGVILKCLEKNPEDRYQSARELAVDLRHVRGGSPFTVPHTAPSSRPAQPQVASIVALPATVFGREADQFLADAVPSAISTQLARIQGLETKAPPRSLDVERLGGDLDRISQAYGVGLCVQSTITAEVRRLNLAVHVVDARTRRLLWAGEYQGTRKGYLSLVRQAADGIREAVRPAAQAVATMPGTSEAELLVQRGIYYSHLYMNRGRQGDFDRAIQTLQEALAADPGRADAAEAIAILHLATVVAGTPVTQVWPEAERWARSALAINPRAPRAWSVLSEIEPGATLEAYRRKLEYALKGATFGPRDAYAQSRLCASLGVQSLRLAIAAAHEAAALDPLLLMSQLYEAITLAAIGRSREGLERIDATLAIEPDMPFGLYMKALILNWARREEDALELLERIRPFGADGRLHPVWIAFAEDVTRFAIASKQGEMAESDRLCERLTGFALGATPFPRWQGTTSGVASILVRWGRTEAALGLLLRRREAGIPECADMLLLNDDLEPVRREPRFRELVDRSMTGFEHMFRILSEARSRGELPAYLDRPLSDLVDELEARRRI
jgi:non-specific serine/threonine protein kinase